MCDELTRLKAETFDLILQQNDLQNRLQNLNKLINRKIMEIKQKEIEIKNKENE